MKCLLMIDGPSGHEVRIRKYLTTIMAGMGISNISTDPTGNLIAIIPGQNSKGLKLLLTAHMDTVPGFSGVRELGFTEHGHIIETGNLNLGADDRCGIAMVIEVLRYCMEHRSEFASVTTVFTVLEESGWQGSSSLDQIIIHGIDLAVSADVPVRTSHGYSSNILVYHMDGDDPFLDSVLIAGKATGIKPILYSYREGYVGGDASVLFKRGLPVLDFCSCAVNHHRKNEYFSFPELIVNTDWMIHTIDAIMQYNVTTQLNQPDGVINNKSSSITYIQKICGNIFHSDGSQLSEELRVIGTLINEDTVHSIEKEINKIITRAEETYDPRVLKNAYELAYKIYVTTKNEILKQSIAIVMIIRCRKHHPAFEILYFILSWIVEDIRVALMTAFVSRSRYQFLISLLPASHHTEIVNYLTAREIRNDEGWDFVAESAEYILSNSQVQLTPNEAMSLLRSSLGNEVRERSVLCLFRDHKISLREIITQCSNCGSTVSYHDVIVLLKKIYHCSMGSLKESVITWLGEMDRDESAHFLMELFTCDVDRSDSVIDAIAHNARRLMVDIIGLYQANPHDALPLFERITLNLEKIFHDFIDVITDDSITPELLRRIWLQLHREWSNGNICGNTDMFLYCSLKKTVDILNIYGVEGTLRVIAIISNLYEDQRRNVFYRILNSCNLFEYEELFHYLIESNMYYVERFIAMMNEGIDLHTISCMLLSCSVTSSYDLSQDTNRERFHSEICDDISYRRFEMLYNDASTCSIPDCWLKFPTIMVRGGDECINCTSTDLLNYISDMAPNACERYNTIFRRIFEDNILGKKRGKALYREMKRILKNNVDDSGIIEYISTQNDYEVLKLYQVSAPIVLNAAHHERRVDVLDIAFLMFIEYFTVVNNEIFITDKRDYNIFEFIQKVLTPKLLTTETEFYFGYFPELKASHCVLFKNCNCLIPVCDAVNISDLRQMYRQRRNKLLSLLRNESESKERGTICSELSVINKIMKEFFIYEMFIERIKGISGDLCSKGNSILFEPVKDASLVFRSCVGNDCNTGNMDQVNVPETMFYRLLHNGTWRGYVTCVLLSDRKYEKRAVLIDVVNMHKVPCNVNTVVTRLIHELSVFCEQEGIDYIFSAENISQFSNQDYVRNAAEIYYNKSFDSVSNWIVPNVYFQSIYTCTKMVRHNDYFNIIWKKD